MADSAETPRTGAVWPEDGIAERIKKVRKELDLSVEELSALTARFDIEPGRPEAERGISVPTLYRYEANGSKPGARELRILCYALDKSPNWLLLGEEWDREQEVDSRIAGLVRDLLTASSEPRILLRGNQGRREMHILQLSDIKARRQGA